ncbi:hypothetical protein EDD86DRAFT_193919 [Gorgonomyces haynaldii]|nr:hypothetical protein EDD86DRAFT_193919 [Gorgonomyces haynaldii]
MWTACVRTSIRTNRHTNRLIISQVIQYAKTRQTSAAISRKKRSKFCHAILCRWFRNSTCSTTVETRNLVDSKIVLEASLHKAKPLEQHIYALPSIGIYIVYFYVSSVWSDLFESSPAFGWFWLMLCVSAHALSFLVCQWSINLKARFTTNKAKSIDDATLIKIQPIAHNGKPELCHISKTSADISFVFQKKKYLWNQDKKRFQKLDYLHSRHHSFKYFKEIKSLDNQQTKVLEDKYGLNRFEVPIPSFQELFKEHMMAPFFIFQLFSVMLWFLDEMWYYSLFTLFMLFVFEATVVFQRLKTLQEFRQMSIPPYLIHVHRQNKWQEIMSDQLLPGDICSIQRHEENPVPADILLLHGTCIANEAMLSGESTPQLKESIELREDDDIFKISQDKEHVLFGGTKILQVQPPSKQFLQTPNDGCLGVVLRSGFATQQGKLVRTIIYATERVTANNLESLFFILFLLFFAMMASWYVWTTGSQEDDRDHSKLLLHCIMIITSVVPTELPMELSMAVNNALMTLSQAFVYCTEPFRIPFAGRIDVACFDKTGTLTAENLIVEGISLKDKKTVLPPSEAPADTKYVLATAHALVLLDDQVIGDPMEKNTVESIDWHLKKGDIMYSKKDQMAVVRRFQFSSQLKRMSTISLHQSKAFISCKGAPETLKSMFKQVPDNYEEHYKYWARRGKRVLALGFKRTDWSLNKIREVHRQDVESDLEFAGFLVFYCPLKPDSKQAITMLNESSHRTVMITGDNALTACHIAKEVGIVKRPVLIYDQWEDQLEWRSIDEKETIANFDPNAHQLHPKFFEHDLCCTGQGLMGLVDKPCFPLLLPRLWVYARVSPSQKELILTKLKQAGYFTLMCGDGTNDVGALKQAHVGVALLDGTLEDIQKIVKRQQAQRQKAILDKQEEMKRKWGIPEEATPQNQREKLKQTMDMLMQELDGDAPVIKFGDASVAAPFTSKVGSVQAVCAVIRQGRATLVALIQMYKILALNSLIMAYSLSVLHLAGIKQGDWQATIAGLMITVCFFGLAKSTPLEKLSKERPQSNIFNPYIIISVLGQAAVHVLALLYIHRESMFYVTLTEEDLPVDAKFRPNLLNSSIYLVSLIMQISTFAINYQGLPFREPLTKNKSMYNSLLAVTAIAFCAAAEIIPELNDYMELVTFPEEVFTITIV